MQISRGKIVRAQKVVVYGPEGIGKSSFASHFPNPIFSDTEGSTLLLDVARTPKPSSWTMLLEQVRYFKANPHELGTLVIDTADWAEQLCMVEICSKSQKSGIEDFGYGKGYVYLFEEFGKLLNLLEELIELGVNVVFTAHAQMRKFEQPDEMGSYDRWEMKLQKKTAPLLREWADMVLFANYETYVVKTDDKKNKAQGGKRVMYTAHHPCWDAKNRHGLDLKLPLDYKAILHCIPEKAGSTKSTEPAEKFVYLDDESERNTKPAEQMTLDTGKQSPKQEQTKQDSKEHEPSKQQDPPKQDLTGVPKPLADLMAANSVTVEEIQQAVSSKGYYPKNTPISNYDPNFVSGVLVGAWVQVFQMIKDFRDDIPF